MEWFKEMNVNDATDFDKLVQLSEIVREKSRHPQYYLRLKCNEEKDLFYYYKTDSVEDL